MADDSSNQRGGRKPGTASAGTSPPLPHEPKPKSPSEPGRVSRNDINLLTLPLRPLHIDWFNITDAKVTRFRLWVPTNSGGVLTIESRGGKVDLRRPFGKVLRPAAAEVSYEVPPGEFGEFFVVATAPESISRVHPRFVQTSFSRDGATDTDPPLIPWNFWYWPTAKDNFYWQKAGDIMARFGKAFGKDPDQCEAAEHTDHTTDAVATFKTFDWQGHCHLAAPASILFEEPRDVTHNGQSFTEDEMKYLALEYWGNFGQVIQPSAWELKRGSLIGKYYLPGYFKPGKAKTRDSFIDGYKRVSQATQGFDEATSKEVAEKVADTFIQQVGGEGNFEKLVNKWLGELAAEFYQALIDYIRVKKHSLMANMRPHEPEKGPEEVWNHALFWYQTRYQEHAPDTQNGEVEDEKFMDLFCELRVNIDVPFPLDATLPATISAGQLTPNENSYLYRNWWRIRFDDAGKIVVADERNAWVSISNGQEELYTPTKLQAVLKPARTRQSAPRLLDIGNKFVGTELVDTGMLKLRKRYR